MAVLWTVCQLHCVRRSHATCGMCRVPWARRDPAPASSPGECCRRMSWRGHGRDMRGSPRTTASPRRACACRLAWQALSPTRRVCASKALVLHSPPGIPGCHHCGTSRVTSGGKGVHDGRLHHVTPIHGKGGCSTTSPFCAKWELQTHARCIVLTLAPACRGCVDQLTARGSRTGPVHDARLCTHQRGICSSFCANHGGNGWGKQIQQAAKCLSHAQIPSTRFPNRSIACTL